MNDVTFLTKRLEEFLESRNDSLSEEEMKLFKEIEDLLNQKGNVHNSVEKGYYSIGMIYFIAKLIETFIK